MIVTSFEGAQKKPNQIIVHRMQFGEIVDSLKAHIRLLMHFFGHSILTSVLLQSHTKIAMQCEVVYVSTFLRKFDIWWFGQKALTRWNPSHSFMKKIWNIWSKKTRFVFLYLKNTQKCYNSRIEFLLRREFSLWETACVRKCIRNDSFGFEVLSCPICFMFWTKIMCKNVNGFQFRDSGAHSAVDATFQLWSFNRQHFIFQHIWQTLSLIGCNRSQFKMFVTHWKSI